MAVLLGLNSVQIMAQAITHDAGYSGLSYEAGVSDKFTIRSNTIGDGTSFKYSLRYTWNGLVDIGVAHIQSYNPEYSGSYFGLYLPETQVFSSWVVTRQCGNIDPVIKIQLRKPKRLSRPLPLRYT